MSAKTSRTAWLDSASNAPLIAEQAKRLDSFVAALADGIVDAAEIAQQEARVVKLMHEVEPLLDDNQHARVTQLLIELTAYDLMQTMQLLQAARPKAVFRG